LFFRPKGGTWIVFENSVPRKMFGPRREEVIEGWTKLRHDELHNLYCLPDITVMKSGMMRCTGHVARTRVISSACIFVGVLVNTREFSDSIKDEEFDKLSDCKFLKRASLP
jgi:hypothetical protein